MLRAPNEGRPVARRLPADPAARRRLAAWLGVLTADLARLFEASPGGVPLGPAAPPAVTAARATELSALGLPAEVDAGAPGLARATAWLLRVGLLAALIWAAGMGVAEGIEPYRMDPPGALVVFGLVLPTFAASVVAGGALPAWLCLALIGWLRQRSGQVALGQAGALVGQLAERGVTGRAAEVDARARALARRVVEAELADPVEQELLRAIDQARTALRRSEAPPDALIAATDQQLARLEAGLGAQQAQELLADDPSSPLAGLRAAAAALQRSGG